MSQICRFCLRINHVGDDRIPGAGARSRLPDMPAQQDADAAASGAAPAPQGSHPGVSGHLDGLLLTPDFDKSDVL